MSQKLRFFSKEWAEQFKQEVQNSPTYKPTAVTWEGEITLIMLAEPEAKIEEDIYLFMDLWHGECRDMKIVSKGEGEKAPFIITATYERWKQVVLGELEPIKGMMQGKLKLKGNLPYIVRYVKAAQELVKCTQNIPTLFPDEE